MPQLRSFTGFAGTPGIGAAYVGGMGVAQRAQEAAMQAANQRAQISNQYAMAEMEANQRQQQLAQEVQLKQQAMQQEAFKSAQELEVQKAYQQAQIGLKERDVAVAEQKQQQEIMQVADAAKSRMAMQRDVQELIAAGETPANAFRQAMVQHGPTANLPGTAWSDVIDQQSSAQFQDPNQKIGTMSEVEGQPGWRVGRTGPNSSQFIPPDKQAAIPEDVAFDPSLVKAGSRYFEKPSAKEADKLEKERDALKKQLRSNDFSVHRALLSKAADPKAKLSIGEKAKIKDYQERQAEIEALNKQIADLRGGLTNSAALPAGGSTNRTSRFKIIKSE